MRGEDHAPGVTAPVLGIEGGIVFRQVRVAGVAEDRLHEVEIADHAAGDKKPDLHAFFRSEAGHFGADDRAQQERHHRLGFFLLILGKGQAQQRGGRIQRGKQNATKHVLRHRLLVVGDRQSALRDVKHALRGAAVVDRIVQDAIGKTVAAHDVGLVVIGVRGQRQNAGEAGTIEDKGTAGQAERSVHVDFADIVVHKVLDAAVGRAEVVRQQARLFLIVREQRFAQGNKRKRLGLPEDRTPVRGQLQIDVFDQDTFFLTHMIQTFHSIS